MSTKQVRDRHLQPRAAQIFAEHFRQLHRQIDRMFVVLMCIQWTFAVGMVLWTSPFAWNGIRREVHPHVWLSLFLGGAVALPVMFAGLWYPGRRWTRHLIALCQIAYSSLLIHLCGGRIETHFHVFGSLAFLAAYRDWTVLIPATCLTAVDHLMRGMFWPESVFGVATPSHWRWLEHAGWVMFENVWLVMCCRQGITEVESIARNRAQLERSQEVLEQQTGALEEALNERRAIVEGALDGILQMNPIGQIIDWNSQATEIFGWEKSEALGRYMVELLLRDKHDGTYWMLSDGISKIVNQRIEIDAVRKDGTVIPIELAITEINCKHRTRYSGFVRDISERRLAEERLHHAKEAAESANQAKSQFLANMSHEIRTPLNAILGFTEILRSGDGKLSSDERRSYLDTVHRGGTHLLDVINDVLDLSKIEAGQMTYERIRFSPHQAIADTISFLQVRAKEKGISLSAKWVGPIPETIESDPGRVRQLLLNLIGNAIKFTEQGGVEVEARVLANESLLQVDVLDTGIGIPASKINSLFQPFTQADVSVTRRFGGTGLGLSICKHFAEALGGSIQVHSVEGEGSRFTITIATGSLADVNLLTSLPNTSSAPSESTAELPRLDGMRVLVVDDGDTNRRLLQVMLGRAGAVVDQAENGVVAIEKASANHYDVILMDMQMPLLDGYTATRRLRERGNTTTVIALTAHAMSGEREKCCAAGCDSYLTKPIDRRELILAMAQLPRTVSVTGEAGGSASAAVSQASIGNHLASKLDLTDPDLRQIVSKFVDRLDDDVEQLNAAWQNGDLIQLAQRSHKLCGTAGLTGFMPLSEAAGSLETACLQHDDIATAQLLATVRDLVTMIQPIYVHDESSEVSR